MPKYLIQGSGSIVEVNPYLSKVEELKHKVIAIEQKLALHEERICLLKKMLGNEEAQSWAYANGVKNYIIILWRLMENNSPERSTILK